MWAGSAMYPGVHSPASLPRGRGNHSAYAAAGSAAEVVELLRVAAGHDVGVAADELVPPRGPRLLDADADEVRGAGVPAGRAPWRVGPLPPPPGLPHRVDRPGPGNARDEPVGERGDQTSFGRSAEKRRKKASDPANSTAVSTTITAIFTGSSTLPK